MIIDRMLTGHSTMLRIDAMVMHPDDAVHVPESVRVLWAKSGAPLETNRFMPRGSIVGMGRGAAIVRELCFHQDVEKAMKENAEFLALMKRSGLA